MEQVPPFPQCFQKSSAVKRHLIASVMGRGIMVKQKIQQIKRISLRYPFPSYDNSAADDFARILSKNRKFPQLNEFCHYVFKKPSAAEASESVYMKERVK